MKPTVETLDIAILLQSRGLGGLHRESSLLKLDAHKVPTKLRPVILSGFLTAFHQHAPLAYIRLGSFELVPTPGR